MLMHTLFVTLTFTDMIAITEEINLAFTAEAPVENPYVDRQLSTRLLDGTPKLVLTSSFLQSLSSGNQSQERDCLLLRMMQYSRSRKQ